MDTKAPKADIVFRYLGQLKWKTEHVSDLVKGAIEDDEGDGTLTVDIPLQIQFISLHGNVLSLEFSVDGDLNWRSGAMTFDPSDFDLDDADNFPNVTEPNPLILLQELDMQKLYEENVKLKKEVAYLRRFDDHICSKSSTIDELMRIAERMDVDKK